MQTSEKSKCKKNILVKWEINNILYDVTMIFINMTPHTTYPLIKWFLNR